MTTIGNESRPAYVYDAETDTWIPIGIGSHTHDEYIDRTIINAKGDIIVGTALDAVAKLGVGTTGQVLVVNPSTATGLEWANRQETITGAASSITTTNLTSSRALASDAFGKVAVSSVTATELSHISGVTSGIQGQLDGKSPTAGSTSITTLGTVATGTWNATTIGVARGGTGATTLTSGGYLKGAGTSAITSQSGIPAGDINSGSLASARLPAGVILQVVTATSSTSITSTATSFITSGLTALITPRSTSSRILCLVSMPVVNNTAATASIYTLFRGTVGDTNLGTAGNPSFRGFGQVYNATSEVRTIVSWNFVDSPNTTSQVRYTVGWMPQSNGAEVMAEGRTGVLTLMEIA